MKQIKTIKQLDDILEDRASHDFGLILRGGLMSRKTIIKRRRYSIWNHIDDTQQLLEGETLFNKEITNIGAAMKKGAFYLLKE